MSTRFASIILSILYLALYASQAKPFAQNPNFYVLSASAVGIILLSGFFNYKRLNFSWPHLMLPAIYLSGTTMVFVIINSPGWRLSFLIFSAIILYLLETRLGRESHFLQNVFLFSVFVWYLGIFAGHFYFNLSGWLLSLVVFAATYIFAVQGFTGVTQPVKKYFYWVVALVCAQAAWGLAFWPTYYSVNAVVLFCLFYLLWLFSFSAFFGKLTRAKIYLQLALVAIVLTAILTTSAWQTIK